MWYERKQINGEGKEVLARSTGLGKNVLDADLKDLRPDGDLLILHLETSKPEGWHLRAAMQLADIPSMVKGFMKPSILFFLVRSLILPKKVPNEPESF